MKTENLTFDEALRALTEGKKVRVPEWTGYWFREGEETKVFTRNGDILDTPHYSKYATRTDWEITEGSMGFDFAILALQNGRKLAREGWNGKNMFIVMMEPLYLPPFNTQDTTRKVNDRTAKWIGEDEPLDCQPYIAMYTAQKKWQPGWLPSQQDLFAKDWILA